MSLKRSQSDESNRKTWWGHRGWMPESTRGETSCRRLVESARRHIKNNNKKKEEKEKKKTGEHGGCSCYSSSPFGSLPDDRWPPLLYTSWVLRVCTDLPPPMLPSHTHTPSGAKSSIQLLLWLVTRWHLTFFFGGKSRGGWAYFFFFFCIFLTSFTTIFSERKAQTSIYYLASVRSWETKTRTGGGGGGGWHRRQSRPR